MKAVWKHGMRRALSLLLVLTMLVGMPGLVALAAGDEGQTTTGLPELKLWYDEPSTETGTPGGQGNYNPGVNGNIWQQDTLPIGNGTIGASVWGEIATERLSLNEQTLWLGGPSENRPNYMGGNLPNKGNNGTAAKEVQALFKSGDTSGAAAKARELLVGGAEWGDGGYGYYAPWGELQITTTGVTSATEGTYQRWLSLDNAVAGVQFTANGVTYNREYFVSNPDNVLAGKLTSSTGGAMNLEIRLPGSVDTVGDTITGTDTTVAMGSDTLALCGALPDNQMKFASYLKVVPKDGTVAAGADGKSLVVTGSTELTFFFTAATDYAQVYPVYRTGETDAALATRVKDVLDTAVGKGYDKIMASHKKDYDSLYTRLTLDLGQTETDKTTDVLLNAYNKRNGAPSITEGERRLLEVMLYQYGRYLTISSSRKNSQLPSNLQGIWNYHTKNSPWHSDFHTNVNLQMNYWPTYSANLAECADPLIRYIDSLREPGRVTAKIYAGIEDDGTGTSGFMAHTQNTPFGWTCPGWSYDWGWSPAAISWMLQNCWEYYEYTGDLEYMRYFIYPMMKEYTALYEKILVDVSEYPLSYRPVNEANNLAPFYATVPSYSPEHGPVTAGNTYEQILTWQLLQDTITAAEQLGLDSDKVGDKNTPGTWKYIQAHLLGPIVVGDGGQIKEWYEEHDISKDADGNVMGQGYGHRHMSHMLGLFPGDLVQSKEEWFEAGRVSMENRTDESTGWGMGQRINTWARLRDGDKAHKLIGDLFRNGMYPNLWDAHAPFQIDGNFGYTSGVNEMLAQSNMGCIDLLPALPTAWTTGRADGLLARGNFELDIRWDGNVLTSADILSKNGGECVVRYPNIAMGQVTDGAGNVIAFEVVGEDGDQISFNTAKGQTYTISDVPNKVLSVIENAEAERTADDSITVTWTAKNNETYQVYRQIGEGEIFPVSEEGLTEGEFVDNTAHSALGKLHYYISANGERPFGPVDTSGLRVDDQYNLDGTSSSGSPIVYGGSWGTWNSDSNNYKGTSKFVEWNNVNGQTATLTFFGTGVEVIGYGYSKNENNVTTTTTFDLSIDGGASKRCVASVIGKRQSVLGEVDGLTYGVHTVTMTLEAGKIDFDGFNVLDGKAEFDPPVIDPEPDKDLEISTVGGIEKLWNAGETVQFTANLDGVTWSMTSTFADHPSDHPNAPCRHDHAATISDKGLVTAGTVNETLTVTATKGSKVKTATIDVIPATTTTIVEDANSTINYTRGSSFTTYWGENTRHHGGSKTEGWTQLTYDFTGTGIGVYSAKYANGGGMKIYIDNVQYTEGATDGIFSLLGDNNDQALVAKITGLSNGSHTIRCEQADLNGKSGIDLDFFEVYAPNPDVPAVDMTALKTAVAAAAEKNEADYTEASWADLKTALDAATAILNGTASNIDAPAVSNAATAITDAIGALDPIPLTAPVNVKVAGCSGTSIAIVWDAVEKATAYEVYINGEKAGETASTVYQFEGLTPKTAYSITVKAKNSGSTSEASTAISETTKDTIPPAPPTALQYADGTLSWTAPGDDDVAGYKVYVNGVVDNDASNTVSRVLSLDASKQYTIQVVAVDGAGNESSPAVLSVAPTYTLTLEGATLDSSSATSGQFKKGEAVTVTATVAQGSALKSWSSKQIDLTTHGTEKTISFAMPGENATVTATTAVQEWEVQADLTNLTSNAPATAADSTPLTVRLSVADPYEFPKTIQVTRNGERLQAPWVNYDANKGEISFIANAITGDIVITAVASVPEPTSETYTAEDRFQLPVTPGSTTALEAERMILTGATRGYGPSHGNQHIAGAAGNNTFVLYYNAPVVGRYDMILNYSSGRNASDPAELNWSGEKVTTHTGSLPNTLVSGKAEYKTTTLMLDVTEEGQGTLTFTSNKAEGLNIDSITFKLTKPAAVKVSKITLDKTAETLYLNGSAGENTVTIGATVTPDDAENKTLRWEPSDSSVASVTQAGLVTARKNGTTTIKAMAMDGSGVEATAEITVKTRVSGEVGIAGSPKFGQSLRATINQISSQDAKNGLTYQWKRNGTAIPDATDITYTLVEEDIGSDITVTVTVTGDYFVGADNGTSATPVTITKADGPAVVVTLGSEDCTDENNNDGKITGLNPDRTYEYQGINDGDTWKTSDGDGTRTEITGLTPGSYHIRVMETTTMNAGPVSRTLTILAYDASGEAINIADSFEGGVVRADVRKANQGDKVTLTVIPAEGYQLVNGSLKVNDGDVEVSGSGDTFTFIMPDSAVTVTAEFELKTYTILHSLNNVKCTMAEHSHKVSHGDMPTITLEAEEGFDLPETIVITHTAGGARFTDYTYVDGKIVFLSGIDDNLTIQGDGVKKTIQVFYKMYGLTSLDGPRSVEWKDALNLTLAEKEGYTLPATITLTMNDTPLTAGEDGDYTYNNTTGVIAVKAGVLTNDVTISAEGVSSLPELRGVTITSSGDKTAPKVGDQLTAGVEEDDAFPDYQWIRIDAEGNETFIEGATNRTYVLKAADEGYIIKVAATGTSNYSGTVFAALSAKVAPDDSAIATGITLNHSKLTLTVMGARQQLAATVTPSAANQTVTWSSSDPTVVSVTTNGVVEGKKVGKATITATTLSGGLEASCEVTVVAITMEKSSVTVNVGATLKINATIPSDLPGSEVEWSSADPSIAEVDEDGVVTGVAVGKTTITVTKGDFSASCEVTVKTRSTGSGSSTPSETTTTQVKEDGTKVTTVTKPDGSKVETVEQPDGTKSETLTTKEGDVTITVTDESGEELVKAEIPATIPEPETKFEDVDTTPWAEEAIHKMAGLELVNGTGSNKYSPVAPMTRGSLATVLHRLSQGKTDYENTFKDVAEGKYYTEGVAWAAKANVVKGISEDIFAPDDIITREQLAVMLARYAKLIGMDTKADVKALEAFTDGENTGSWAIDGVAWCVENGILKGKGQNDLDPTADVTRAEVAVMLDRFIGLIQK